MLGTVCPCFGRISFSVLNVLPYSPSLKQSHGKEANETTPRPGISVAEMLLVFFRLQSQVNSALPPKYRRYRVSAPSAHLSMFSGRHHLTEYFTITVPDLILINLN